MKRSSILLFFSLSSLISATAFAQNATVFFTTSMNFGPVDSDLSAMKPIVVSTRFDTVHTVHGSISLPTNSAFTLIGSDTFTVGPRLTDTVAFIRFSPTAATAFADSIFITHDGSTKFAKNPAKIIMTGQGLPGNDTSARITLSRMQITWNNYIDTAVMKTLVIKDDTSTGTIRTLRGTILGVHAPFSLFGDTNFTIAPGVLDTLQFSFMSSDTGHFIDTLTVQSNADSIHSALTVYLAATALPLPPKLSLSVSAIDFGKQQLTHDTTIDLYLRETSGHLLRIQNVSHSPKAPFTITGRLDSIAANKTDTLAIMFSPTDSITYTDSLVFSTNESAGPGTRHVIQFTGQGFVIPPPPPPPPPQGVNAESITTSKVVVYPNPSKTEFWVTLPNSTTGNAHISLVDEAGKTFEKDVRIVDGKIGIPVTAMPTGTYHLHIRTNRSVYESSVSIVR